MKAQTKQEFIERWEELADEFSGLMHSAESADTLGKISGQITEIKKVIAEVADECFNESDQLTKL